MEHVRIVEVGPRDGLQNITQVVPTSTKVELIQRLGRTGLSVIEATSFVSPKWIPQLKDGAQVLQAIQPMINPTANNIHFPVLVPNVRGLELAIQNGAREVAVFVSATEAFSKRNINCTVAESLFRVRQVAKRAKELNVRVRGYISCIFADPYEGPTRPEQVIGTTQALLDAGCYEVSLGDTLGVGTPHDVRMLFTALLETIPASSLAGHFHDTYGQAIANVVESYKLGIRTFDSSVAGLGGCPFAKGAKGNLSTEDLVYTLEKMGVSTGVNLNELVKTGAWISQQLGIPTNSRAGAAIAAKLQESIPKAKSPIQITNWNIIEAAEGYRVRRSGANVEICLTRTKNGNALTTAMIQSLTRLFKKFSEEESVFRIVLRGEGRFFCTGMDLKSTTTTEQQYENLKGLLKSIDECPKVTIALVNGPCFGGGVGLAFVCDIRLATSNSTFTLSEVGLGLCPATISKYVIREWGLSYTRAAMLAARKIEASELEAMKIIQRIVPDQTALNTAAEELLHGLRFCAPGASKLSKDLVRVAYKDAGGQDQEEVIRKSYFEMMTGGSEHSFARSQFKNGVKRIDWDEMTWEKPVSKL